MRKMGRGWKWYIARRESNIGVDEGEKQNIRRKVDGKEIKANEQEREEGGNGM